MVEREQMPDLKGSIVFDSDRFGKLLAKGDTLAGGKLNHRLRNMNVNLDNVAEVSNHAR
jgi:hypothetical protein